VLGPSPKSEGRPPLSLPARAAIYTLLATLVVASFVVTPRRAGTGLSAYPATVGRALAASRGIPRAIRDVAEAELEIAPEDPALPSFEARTQVVILDGPADDSDFAPATPEAAAEARMLALINASRTNDGLAPVAMDEGVSAVAREHSAAESGVRYVYHDGIDGSAHTRDAAACGTAWYGENTGKIWNDNVDALHREFMSEPWEPINHRTNIMGPLFHRVGIGAVIGPDAIYMTMVFCR
jgi:uncharacterized protein YkwD